MIMELITLGIAILSSLISFYTIYNNKAKLKAEVFDIQIDSTRKIMEELRTELDRQKLKIQELTGEIVLLKSQEKIHIIEKVRLEERINVLTLENEELRLRVESNRIVYNQQLVALDDQIVKLKSELQKYRKIKNE